MRRTRIALLTTTALAATAMPRRAEAAAVAFTDFASWQAAAGDVVSISFADLPQDADVGEHYAALGVHFTDGADIVSHDLAAFVSDGVGFSGSPNSTTLQFDAAISAAAFDLPGSGEFKIYNNKQLLYASPVFGGAGVGHFGGIVSDQPFDKIIMFNPLPGGFSVDNLHFGPPIPAPGAMAALLGAGAFVGRSRRRAVPYRRKDDPESSLASAASR